jgi:2-polyprenyl-6-methoxyphenol hydroxylase-like FAD-dependent oxidoreductase
MPVTVSADDSSPEPRKPRSQHNIGTRRRTTCCIVGAGPGGAVLALILARQGIDVTLLEAHEDFDRDFRGDTIHPSVLEIMDQLGLADRLLQLRHSKLHSATFVLPDGPLTIADFRRLDTKFPYIAMLPQVDFLEFLTNEAKQYPNFHLLMGASAQELIEEEGEIKGVNYRNLEGWHEVRADLTVGADGRSSRIRLLAGFEPIKTSSPMDILWFRIPRHQQDPEGVLAHLGRGHILILLDRLDQWQVGYVIFKGSFQEVRTAGLASLRRSIAELMVEFPERADHLQDWKQVAVLSVESSRVRRWYRPGLLLIGDAAHVMSPVGGVGINYAVQDAVVAANVLSASLKSGRVTTADLREVQRQREWPTRIIQAIQNLIQRRVVGAALQSSGSFRVPWIIRFLLRIPGLRDLPGRILALGVRRVRLQVGLETKSQPE